MDDDELELERPTLVVRLGVDRLRAEGMDLDLPRQLAQRMSESRGTECYLLDVSSLREFRRALRYGVNGQTSFESVLVVGHSNEEGIVVSDEAEGFVSWTAFGDWLSAFDPWSLVLVACNAGHSTCGRALFDSVPSLERILACPTRATKQFGVAVVAALGGATDEWLDGRRTALTQLFTAMTTGQLLVTWFREDLDNPLSAAVQDLVHQVVAVVADEGTRDLRADLARLFLPRTKG